MSLSSQSVDGDRWSWNWILNARQDLFWYIGSSLAGWGYVLLVFSAGRGLEDPIRDPFFTLELGGFTLPLTLGLLVVASWGLLIDSPHVWATLARTFLDPDEWRVRQGVLVGSLGWFVFGPAVIFGPYLVGTIVPLSSATMALGGHLFLVFFRLWAYYHVVRQHWGFLTLYKRKNADTDDPVENRADRWLFNGSLYLPLILFISAPWYSQTGMPPLGLSGELIAGSGLSAADVLNPIGWTLYPLLISGYAVYQWSRFRAGDTRNGPKLLFLFSIVPLHLVVFIHPLLALFVVPIVTVGHNLQYHRIVWTFGRRKYLSTDEARYRLPRFAFRSVAVYFTCGLVFTFAFYQGPWVQFVQTQLASVVSDYVVPGIGTVAGVSDPASSRLGARIVSALFLGWAMQHYYLDAKIWRVSRDEALAKNLNV